ncbi:D-alanyl-D-alanine carboxypeptidase [Rhodovulum bhavnagarense]|uniref:D-alanyl-D-alanine carboxypeptidase n=1 Tax=Rhodovulum bhavnagarense TaxID=992286 RepID=A0A4R2RGE0_9RHOB|nr:D-alanyl-D-alanine carboxypeptidase family protein [Rhodovulum bhavnagarense]TCP62742.1 D-alanyl-D-alanine carboxypeptidase [Rhodovulum bhavnagarense]
MGLVAIFVALGAAGAWSAPYAALVIDARTGEVLHETNADTRLHPASLTKMMTLYIAFEAVEHGEIGLDDEVRISKKAAAEPPSKLGLRAGQKIKLRYLIRAAAVKSANDAATAIGEAIEGSEAAFARRMNRTAQAMGMTRTTFKNANGLTEEGHMSTARDMTTLGRHMLYDYPEYYNLFSRQSTDAGIATVSNTNRRLLSSYRGADGIKTGYTRAAGFNLVASAHRGGERVIATVFGGRSVVTRNAKVAELLDLGFQRAPSRVAMRLPAKPAYGATIRMAMALTTSPRPVARPLPGPSEALIAALTLNVASAVEEAQAEMATRSAVPVAGIPPAPRPEDVATPVAVAAAAGQDPEIVTRLSSSGGRHWGIKVGRYGSRYQAERVLLQTALREIGTLDEALRKVVQTPRGFEAQFIGMAREEAALACRRLQASGASCTPIGPAS